MYYCEECHSTFEWNEEYQDPDTGCHTCPSCYGYNYYPVDNCICGEYKDKEKPLCEECTEDLCKEVENIAKEADISLKELLESAADKKVWEKVEDTADEFCISVKELTETVAYERL